MKADESAQVNLLGRHSRQQAPSARVYQPDRGNDKPHQGDVNLEKVRPDGRVKTAGHRVDNDDEGRYQEGWKVVDAADYRKHPGDCAQVAGDEHGETNNRENRNQEFCLFVIAPVKSEEHTSELQSPCNLVCRLLLEKKKKKKDTTINI